MKIMKEIYLDNSATTALSEAAKKAILETVECYGNPSSLHPVGQRARTILEQARKDIALTLGVRGTLGAGELVFTSCGSESDNLAILGVAYAKPRRKGGRIITTDSEHAGVENAMRALERDGFEVIRISTRGGVLDFEQYKNALNDRTFLVSMMMMNNETGAWYDIKRAFSLAKAKNHDIVTHTDAVQGYLKVPFTPAAIKADFVTLSGHKIHAPKGIGALYVSPEALKRRDYIPLLLGGGQESGFRSGTENLIGIAAFGAAAKDGFLHLQERTRHLCDLRDYAVERLSALGLQLNLPKGSRAPHVVNLTLPDIKSETMLHALSAYGICVSQGSACSTHAKKVSSALLAFGLPEAQAECSLRVSFGMENTREDVDTLVKALEQELPKLVKIHR